MLISWKPKVEARSQRYKLEAKDVPKAYKLGKKKPRGECTQYPQCAFLYVFYVRKTNTVFSKKTDKNGYANFASFVCTQHP